MAKKLKQRVGELMKQQNLTYSVFARKLGIGIKTAKGLYEDPYHNLRGSTLLRCAEFFGVEPGELVVEEDREVQVSRAIAPSSGFNKSPADSELIDKLLGLVFPESLLSQARSYAGKDLAGFVQQAIAEKMERERSQNTDLSSEKRTISNQIMVSL